MSKPKSSIANFGLKNLALAMHLLLSFRISMIALILFLFPSSIYSQCVDPANNSVDCFCDTATILCTPDDLDNYSFTMSAISNKGGFSNDLCPESPNGGWPNNVNWFSFISWCTDLDIKVNITNCSDGGGSNSHGAQVGLFASCGGPWDPLACMTSAGASCGSNSTNYPTSHTLNVTGMIIGNQYWFMLDGCSGSACDISIDILGVCGSGTIDPWNTGITGPLTVCQGETATYFTEDLNGAVEFYYYLDTAPVANGTELKTYTHTWNNLGTYELCVDVSNLPCIEEVDDPLAYCITIEVIAPAGSTLNLSSSNLCPGETATISLNVLSPGPEYTHTLLVTDNAGIITDLLASPSDMSNGLCTEYNICSFSYFTSVGPFPAIGDNINSYDCITDCCSFDCQTLSFEDLDQPIFTNPPSDTSITCVDFLTTMADLSYTDNCIIPGQVSGVEVLNSGVCNGGMIVRTWEISDQCNNLTSHVQTITIAPVITPVLTTVLPLDMTISCAQISSLGPPPDFEYTNNDLGGCLIEGLIPPVESGMSDLCSGGDIIYTWNGSDACGNLYNHVQRITIQGIPAATYINPPADTIVTCDNIPTNTSPILNYSNGLTGSCLLSGNTAAVQNPIVDLCGGTIINTWTDMDNCGNQLTHTQQIVVTPVPAAIYINLPMDLTVDCNNLPSNTAPPLDFSNGLSGNCLLSGTTPGVQSGSVDLCGGIISRRWTDVDLCGNPLDHIQIITVLSAPLPTLLDIPADLTLSCVEDNIELPLTLSYDYGLLGNCGLADTIPGIQTIVDLNCGKTITNNWSSFDLCGYPLGHIQHITILPPPAAKYIDLPMDITVDCDDIPIGPVELFFSNGIAGNCELSGSTLGVSTGSYDHCGGEFIYTWTDVDNCGNALDHQQIVTVLPAPAPEFIDPPKDLMIVCDRSNFMPDTLFYTNSFSEACEISGATVGVFNDSLDYCDRSFLVIWNEVDDCGNTLYHEQQITVVSIAQVYIPNIFSPGDDNINDKFTLYGNVALIEEMQVFDRWGNLVFYNSDFSANDETEGWDGRFKGATLVQGVYIYMINARLLNGDQEQYQGTITLINN